MKEKIGIWGFGTTGKAAVQYCSQALGAELEVLDKRLPTELSPQEQQLLAHVNSKYTSQTDLHGFLERNTRILPSPGIDLRGHRCPRASGRHLSVFHAVSEPRLKRAE